MDPTHAAKIVIDSPHFSGEVKEALRALVKDAQRYDYLRNHEQGWPENVGGAISFSFQVRRPEPEQWCVDKKRGKDMDAAIDAAMVGSVG